MKTLSRIACSAALLIALTPPAHAGFLLVNVRESTLELIWQLLLVVAVLLVFTTLRKSSSKGGNGK